MSLFANSNFYCAPPPWREYICGFYYNIDVHGRLQKTYLPQVQLDAHATILSTTSRTILNQTFVNPSKEKGIREVRYTFPLYDGVSVVGFTCEVADRVIVGEVKEKEKARAVFKEAVARGETAGLLEQLPEASDVFTTTVGNIPPGAKILVKITYLGELKHDMEVNGIRYTIPNIICPRYGSYPGNLRTTPAIEAMGGGISITIDAEMADGSFIQKMQSPTHPISMTMGTTSSRPDADPTLIRASATLALGTAGLEKDFVIQVIAKNTGLPKAILETHPSISNQRALMATLVPKFALPPEKPELVFVCDRSGSMSGSNIKLVVQALQVFLKSLPVGVKFNICSFGSTFSFLWPKSMTYSQDTLDQAVLHAGTFMADYGGTEMLQPLKATIERRYKDLPLDVMLLTDGEIWNQQALFTYLNESVTESKAPIRVFTLGIGNGVSHALIEGIAKAGNGFSQTVGQGEKMDTKVVRMLKGALSPHVNDYTLEVKYPHVDSSSAGDDDFEIVEKVTDSLQVNLNIKDQGQPKPVSDYGQHYLDSSTNYMQKHTISLFDDSADPDKEEPPVYDETGESKYAHLPQVPIPKILQAPQSIPSLFAFNRTTVYLLLGPEAPAATPSSVLLRGTSVHGPLELEIPIQVLEKPGETIHQLAARRAVSELEQGRGWLPESKEPTGSLVKTKFEGQFSDMVEREAVRLGVQFQVGGKWCAFVAVESKNASKEDREKNSTGWEWLEDEMQAGTVNVHGSARGIDHSSRSKYIFDSDSDDSCSSSDDNDYGANRFLRDVIDESDSEDAALEEEIDSNLENLQGDAQRLNALGKSMSEEVDRQNTSLQRLMPYRCTTDTIEFSQTAKQRLTRITDKTSTDTAIPPPPPPPRNPFAPQPPLGSSSEVADMVQAIRKNLDSSITRGYSLDQSQNEELTAKSKMFYSQAKKQQSSGLFGGLFGGARASSSSSPPQNNRSSFTNPVSRLFGSNNSNSGGGGPFESASSSNNSQQQPTKAMLFGSAAPSFGPPPSRGGIGAALFGAAPSAPGSSPFGALSNPPGNSLFGATPTLPNANVQGTQSLQDYQMGLMKLEQQNKSRLSMARMKSSKDPAPATTGPAMSQPPPRDYSEGDEATVFGGSDVGMALEHFDFDSFLQNPEDLSETQSSTVAFGGPAPAANTTTGPFGHAVSAASATSFGSAGIPQNTGGPLFGEAASAPALSASPFSMFGGSPSTNSPFLQKPSASSSQTTAPVVKITPEQLMHYLISLQTFEGSWKFSQKLLGALEVKEQTFQADLAEAEIDETAFVTALVIATFKKKLKQFDGSWELVVDKARGWLAEQGVSNVDELISQAGILVK